jgi:hypothetical protein
MNAKHQLNWLKKKEARNKELANKQLTLYTPEKLTYGIVNLAESAHLTGTIATPAELEKLHASRFAKRKVSKCSAEEGKHIQLRRENMEDCNAVMRVGRFNTRRERRAEHPDSTVIYAAAIRRAIVRARREGKSFLYHGFPVTHARSKGNVLRLRIAGRYIAVSVTDFKF